MAASIVGPNTEVSLITIQDAGFVPAFFFGSNRGMGCGGLVVPIASGREEECGEIITSTNPPPKQFFL